MPLVEPLDPALIPNVVTNVPVIVPDQNISSLTTGVFSPGQSLGTGVNLIKTAQLDENGQPVASTSVAVDLEQNIYTTNINQYSEQNFISNVQGGDALCVGTVNSSNNYLNITCTVTKLGFSTDSGFCVTDIGGGVTKVTVDAQANAFKCWNINGGPGLVACGNDTVNFIAGANVSLTANNASAPKTITIDSSASVSLDATCSFKVGNGLASNTGGNNLALGQGALLSNTSGSNNVGLGSQAGSNITTGSNNTILGSLPGTTGMNCTVLIGAGACERIRVDNNGICVNGAILQGDGLSTTAAGYRYMPGNTQVANYVTVASDAGKTLIHPASDATPRTFTIASNASVPYPVGTTIVFVNDSTGVISITVNSDTLKFVGSGALGTRSLAQYGLATAIKVDATTWYIVGTNLS